MTASEEIGLYIGNSKGYTYNNLHALDLDILAHHVPSRYMDVLGLFEIDDRSTITMLDMLMLRNSIMFCNNVPNTPDTIRLFCNMMVDEIETTYRIRCNENRLFDIQAAITLYTIQVEDMLTAAISNIDIEYAYMQDVNVYIDKEGDIRVKGYMLS